MKIREMGARKRILVGAGVLIAVAAVGVSGAALLSSPQPGTPAGGLQLVSQSKDVEPALPCDVVQNLDQQTQERAATSRGSVPGTELWPPIQPGFDPNEPPPATAPIDPDAGVPKDQLEQEIPPEALEEIQRMESELSRGAAAQRPCGDVVEKIREQTLQSPHGTVCYLADGRFGSSMLIDMIPADPTAPIDVRPPQEVFDSICQSNGFDRSYQ